MNSRNHAGKDIERISLPRSEIIFPCLIIAQWAEDYFRDLDAEEDKEQEEKFVPRQFQSKTTSKQQKADQKKPDKKQEQKKQEVSADEGVAGQLMLDFVAEVKAG